MTKTNKEILVFLNQVQQTTEELINYEKFCLQNCCNDFKDYHNGKIDGLKDVLSNIKQTIEYVKER